MRELKFRAWHNHDKKMYEIAELDLFWGLATLQWWEKEGKKEVRYVKMEGITGEIDNGEKDPLQKTFGIEIMQYTGLKDDNGVEIYEGDIAKLVWDGEETTLEVIFDLEELAYLGRYVRYVVPKYKYLSVNNEIKIIGNTYENPELLEAVRK